MAVLLDTHVWAWWSLGDARLPVREREALATHDRVIRRSRAARLWKA
jgi:PIN domain nuclease of toxin-antitoxin system